MSTAGASKQPARASARLRGATGVYETADFANRRTKRRRANEIAKAARKKNRR